MFELIFQGIAVIAAAVAAWLWLQSTKVAVPNTLGVARWASSDALSEENEEKRWANEISEKNRRAALATAVSVAAQGAAVLISIFTGIGPA